MTDNILKTIARTRDPEILRDAFEEAVEALTEIKMGKVVPAFTADEALKSIASKLGGENE